MKVNNIPTLTWNHLKVNYAETGEQPAELTDVAVSFRKLPEGVSHAALTQEEADAWILSHAPAQPAEAVVAGKAPMYHPQTFGTGLGAQFDELVRTSGTAVHLLEAAPGVKAKEPILWDLQYPDASASLCSQILHVGAGASLTVLLTCRSVSFFGGTAGISTKILLEPGAELFLAKSQMLGSGFTFLDDTGASLLENASLRLVEVELGAGKAYVGVQPEMDGDGSRFEARMAYLGLGDRLIDINYNAIARGKRTGTQMTFDGVLTDRSSKTFRGTIDFRRGSAGSSGHEKENVLLLSDDIVNKTLPVILCEEEDMEGSHGATIGRLDQDMLFYLASRGIGEKAAERMMVRARLSFAAQEIPDERLRAELVNTVEEAFQD